MEIIEISEQEKLIEIIRNGKAVVLYFYNDNCAPCLSIRPKLEALIKANFPNFTFIYINGEKSPSTQAHFGVFENPTIIFFFEGKESFRESKYISIINLEEKIGRIYNLLFEYQ